MKKMCLPEDNGLITLCFDVKFARGNSYPTCEILRRHWFSTGTKLEKFAAVRWEKIEIFEIFETQKLVFFQNKVSMKKMFLSEDNAMITLCFDFKKIGSRQLRCRF